MEKPLYVKDIDPTTKGPFEVARRELKKGAISMRKKFFRCSGEREEALGELIDKILERGWIVPSKANGQHNLSLYLKPPDPLGKKAWRLVVDYR